MSLAGVVGEIKSGRLSAHLLRAKIDRALEAIHRRRQEARYAGGSSGAVHVSNLLGGYEFCARKAYYKQVRGEQGYEVHSAKRLMTFYEGDQTEVQLKDLLAKAGVSMFVPVQQKLVGKIVGTPDVGLTWRGARLLGEVKSLHLHAWRALEAPTIRYMQQLGTYMGLFQIFSGLFFVKGKGADEWKFFSVTWSDVKRHASVVLRRGLEVSSAVRGGVLPDRIEGASLKHKVCKVCAYREGCLLGRWSA